MSWQWAVRRATAMLAITLACYLAAPVAWTQAPSLAHDPLLLPGDRPPPSLERMLQPPRPRVPGEQPGVSPPDATPALGMDQSIQAARAAISACSGMGLRVGAAVSDSTGVLRVALTGDSARAGVAFTAARKNAAVVAFGLRTSELQARLRANPALRARVTPEMAVFPGGVPIYSNGKLIGAIAASGATGEQDEACAQAGLAEIGRSADQSKPNHEVLTGGQ